MAGSGAKVGWLDIEVVNNRVGNAQDSSARQGGGASARTRHSPFFDLNHAHRIHVLFHSDRDETGACVTFAMSRSEKICFAPRGISVFNRRQSQ